MKRMVGVIVLLVVLFVIAMGCGSGGGGGNNTAPPAVNNNDAVTSNVGANGGVLTTPSGNAKLIIPAGALTANTTITVSQNVQNGGIGDSYNFEPTGLTFNTPVTISLKYDPTLLPTGINETDLVIDYQDGDNWVGIPSTVDVVSHVVNGQTTHFTTYEKKASHDTLLGNFKGVEVYSNGSHTFNDNPNNWQSNFFDESVTGLRWECTEFVHRYYLQIYGVNLSFSGDASGYYDYYSSASHDGIIAYSNNGTGLPQVGDILISEGTPNTKYDTGHVAIVSGVTSTMVTIVQQNWWEDKQDVTGGYVPINGNKLGIFNGGTYYPVIGWLRLAPQTPPTPDINGMALLSLMPSFGGGVAGIGAVSIHQNGNNLIFTIKATPDYFEPYDTVGIGQINGNDVNIGIDHDDSSGNPAHFEIKGSLYGSNIILAHWYLNYSPIPSGRVRIDLAKEIESPPICSGSGPMGQIVSSDYRVAGVYYSGNPGVLSFGSGIPTLRVGMGWLSGNKIWTTFVDIYDSSNPKAILLEGTVADDCASMSGTWIQYPFDSEISEATGTW